MIFSVYIILKKTVHDDSNNHLGSFYENIKQLDLTLDTCIPSICKCIVMQPTGICMSGAYCILKSVVSKSSKNFK